jgi:FixJ family two-component response regulator
MDTVFLIDDSHAVRSALSRLLSSAGYQVRAFESAARYLDEHDTHAPGCLVVDIVMPGLTGLELQRALSGTGIARPIIFITGKGDIPSTVHAMKAGAVDFLTKPINEQRLLAAINQALQRDKEERQNRAIRGAIEQRLERLSFRERQVLQRVVLGRLNKQIADDLGISEKTVKAHRGQMMVKMGVRSVAELVPLAAQVGIMRSPALCVSAGIHQGFGEAPSS